MKIQPNLILIRRYRQAAARSDASRVNSGQNSVSTVEKQFSAGNLNDIVMLENRRAVFEMPRSQAEVEGLLREVEAGLRRMSPDERHLLYLP